MVAHARGALGVATGDAAQGAPHGERDNHGREHEQRAAGAPRAREPSCATTPPSAMAIEVAIARGVRSRTRRKRRVPAASRTPLAKRPHAASRGTGAPAIANTSVPLPPTPSATAAVTSQALERSVFAFSRRCRATDQPHAERDREPQPYHDSPRRAQREGVEPGLANAIGLTQVIAMAKKYAQMPRATQRAWRRRPTNVATTSKASGTASAAAAALNQRAARTPFRVALRA